MPKIRNIRSTPLFDRSRNIHDDDIRRWIDEEHRGRRGQETDLEDLWERIKQGAFVVWLIFGLIGALYILACIHSHTWPLIGRMPDPLFSLSSTPTPPLVSPSP